MGMERCYRWSMGNLYADMIHYCRNSNLSLFVRTDEKKVDWCFFDDDAGETLTLHWRQEDRNKVQDRDKLLFSLSISRSLSLSPPLRRRCYSLESQSSIHWFDLLWRRAMLPYACYIRDGTKYENKSDTMKEHHSPTAVLPLPLLGDSFFFGQ